MEYRSDDFLHQAGQMIFFGFDGYELNDHARRAIRKYHLGNVILFTRNYRDPAQFYSLIQSLQQEAMEANGVPLLIAIDQEGGSVVRIIRDATWFPGPMATRVAGNPDLARQLGQGVGAEMAAFGDPAELKGTKVGSYRQLQERYQYLVEGNVQPTSEKVDHIFIALGEVVLEGIPFEPFSITTLRIREHSPFRHTLCLGYSNGSLSYFPSMDQIIRGGYEVRMFKTINLIPFRDDSEQFYVTASLQHIRSLYESR